ncbi:MAG: HAD hydrolase-like protein [Oscillospiraceae bacterium]|jgi:phosphoglycolate phosphatase|nr:HAD hydrolase-like protein [Oscillospiraceae bacterium]
MKDYQLMIFDLDGTLLDTTEGILASVSCAIDSLGLPPLPSREMTLSFIGPPVADSFAKHYGLSGALLQKAVDTFRNDYGSNRLFEATPYPGIYDVFEYLRKSGVKTAVATYKREDMALRLLRHYSFDRYTDIMFGADKDNKLQKKDIIMKCIHQSNLGEPKTLVIGDTAHDAMGAEQSGLDFLAVTYGFGFKTGDDLSGVRAVAFVKSPQEIIQWFNG